MATITSQYYIIFVYVFGSAVVISQPFHASIQMYPNVTTDTCGLSQRNHSDDSTGCFTYHNMMPKYIWNGRWVDDGEMPWNVHISAIHKLPFPVWGSGTILNNQWVITCAHVVFCGVNCSATEVTILVSTYKDVALDQNATVFMHPNYTHKDNFSVDIALLKFAHPVDFVPAKFKPFNSVCLPPPGIQNTRDEYALVSGYGDKYDWDTQSKWKREPKAGWVTIKAPFNNRTDYNGATIVSERPRGPYYDYKGTYICRGDSGGPLIQYVNGRAVLIGISVMSDALTSCGSPSNDPMNKFVRVSNYIDWITKTVLDNTP